MSIDYVTKFSPHVDEQFSAESKLSLLTNKDYTFTGAHEIRIYKISTGKMNDYDRTGEDSLAGTGGADATRLSRYGEIERLDATTKPYSLEKDRSFTFAIDKLDEDETAAALTAAKALARQNREVVIPEVDQYVYSKMAEGAGTKASGELTAENIYDEITNASEAMDEALVPASERVLVVTPGVYKMLKKNPDIGLSTTIANELKVKGVVADLDGCLVVKVPSVCLPANFGFMMAHPSATVAPVTLDEFHIHRDPPFISGSLVEGRIAYGAAVLDNKKKGIYLHTIA